MTLDPDGSLEQKKAFPETHEIDDPAQPNSEEEPILTLISDKI